MRLYERLASTLIGTPLQGPAEGLRWLKYLPRRLRHPELHEIYLENVRIQALLDKSISSGMNCIDVGAHLGSVLSKITKLSPGGRHIAIEPLAYKAAWLRKKFPMVDIHECALSNRDETTQFFHNTRASGLSGLSRRGGPQDSQAIVVRCRTLDAVISDSLHVGFVKIDVEGAEYLVLQGSQRLLTRSRPLVLFEATRSGLSNFACSAEQLYLLLTHELRYRIYLIKDWLAGGKPLTLESFETSMVFPFKAFNYIAAPLT